MSTLKRRRSDRRPQLDRIRFEVACNDDHGHFAGIVEAMSFNANGERIGLELCSGSAPRFKELPDGAIYIYRRRCQVYESKEWFGNWCWNAYVIPLPLAAWILRHSVLTGKFSMDMAEGDNACKLSDALDEKASIGEVTLYLSLFGLDR